MSQIALGHEYVVALGLTLPQKEYEKIAKKNSGILRQNPSVASTTKSSRVPLANRSSSRGRGLVRNKSQGKKFLHSNLSDFNQTHFSQSQMSFKKEKLKDVKRSIPKLHNKLEGIKVPRKSKSSSKLSSMTGAKKLYNK